LTAVLEYTAGFIEALLCRGQGANEMDVKGTLGQRNLMVPWPNVVLPKTYSSYLF
jgi:hypothetical protein